VNPPLLDVHNVSVSYRGPSRTVKAVDCVSFTLARGETLGVVGESGCGKSTLAFALTRLLKPGTHVDGEVYLEGEDLLRADKVALSKMRWTKVAMVFQAAMNAMNPVVTVRQQIIEPMLFHGIAADRREAGRKAADLFELVGLSPSRLDAYPHELSGGMRQRAVLAMSLSCRPKLLIADEPTTALDVVIQDQIFLKINEIRREMGLAVILVSHDIGLIAENCDRIAVMYGGRLIELGPTHEVLNRPRHPYTAALSRATPTLSADRALVALPGSAPDLSQPIQGCVFAHRCPVRQEICLQMEPPPVAVSSEHRTSCHFGKDLVASDVFGRLRQYQQPEPASSTSKVIEVRNLSKVFQLKRSLSDVFRTRQRQLTAVNDVSLDVRRGEVIGIVGESGSGKTTLGMILAGLEQPSGGTVRIDGVEVGPMRGESRKDFHRKVQVVFQDPYDSLNPRHRIDTIIEEPLRIHGIGASATERREMVNSILARVGLTPPESFAARFPAELSGGQRQRVAIARAMVVKPQILIADEPLSMLDASVKAGVMSLLADFKRDGVTILVITHDLSITRYLCDRIGVFYLGNLVELGPAIDVTREPWHPYTKLLLASVPDETRERPRKRLADAEPPSAEKRPSGCPFHPRCSEATDICGTQVPRTFAEGQRESSCWHVDALRTEANRQRKDKQGNNNQWEHH